LSQATVAHACNPTTQKAKIRRITVRSQPKQIAGKTLPRKIYHTKKREGKGELVNWLKV
jgi:hypothetical protein